MMNTTKSASIQVVGELSLLQGPGEIAPKAGVAGGESSVHAACGQASSTTELLAREIVPATGEVLRAKANGEGALAADREPPLDPYKIALTPEQALIVNSLLLSWGNPPLSALPAPAASAVGVGVEPPVGLCAPPGPVVLAVAGVELASPRGPAVSNEARVEVSSPHAAVGPCVELFSPVGPVIPPEALTADVASPPPCPAVFTGAGVVHLTPRGLVAFSTARVEPTLSHAAEVPCVEPPSSASPAVSSGALPTGDISDHFASDYRQLPRTFPTPHGSCHIHRIHASGPNPRSVYNQLCQKSGLRRDNYHTRLATVYDPVHGWTCRVEHHCRGTEDGLMPVSLHLRFAAATKSDAEDKAIGAMLNAHDRRGYPHPYNAASQPSRDADAGQAEGLHDLYESLFPAVAPLRFSPLLTMRFTNQPGRPVDPTAAVSPGDRYMAACGYRAFVAAASLSCATPMQAFESTDAVFTRAAIPRAAGVPYRLMHSLVVGSGLKANLGRIVFVDNGPGAGTMDAMLHPTHYTGPECPWILYFPPLRDGQLNTAPHWHTCKLPWIEAEVPDLGNAHQAEWMTYDVRNPGVLRWRQQMNHMCLINCNTNPGPLNFLAVATANPALQQAVVNTTRTDPASAHLLMLGDWMASYHTQEPLIVEPAHQVDFQHHRQMRDFENARLQARNEIEQLEANAMQELQDWMNVMNQRGGQHLRQRVGIRQLAEDHETNNRRDLLREEDEAFCTLFRQVQDGWLRLFTRQLGPLWGCPTVKCFQLRVFPCDAHDELREGSAGLPCVQILQRPNGPIGQPLYALESLGGMLHLDDWPHLVPQLGDYLEEANGQGRLWWRRRVQNAFAHIGAYIDPALNLRRPPEDYAYGMSCRYYFGAAPPPSANKHTHWCACGSLAGNDVAIAKQLQARGASVCNCRQFVPGFCFHYFYRVMCSWFIAIYYAVMHLRFARPVWTRYSTVFTERPLPVTYIVPFERCGWKPFVVPDEELDGGIMLGMRVAEAAGVHNSGHSIVTCRGNWPFSSPIHQQAVGTAVSKDPLISTTASHRDWAPTMSSCEMTFDSGIITRRRAQIAVVVGQLTILAAFAMTVWAWGLRKATVHLCRAPTPLYVPEDWPTIHEPINLFVGAWHFVSWLLLHPYAWCVAALALEVCSRLLGILCLAMCALGLMLCLAPWYRWLFAPIPWRYTGKWGRHSGRAHLPYVMAHVHIPEKAALLPKALAMWDGTSDLKCLLKNAAVRSLQESGWAANPDESAWITHEDLEVLSRCLRMRATHDVPGFARLVKKRLTSLRRTDGRLHCKRPGCHVTATRATWKWGLCDACRASTHLAPTGDSALWTEGKGTYSFYPGSFIAMPEVELPLERLQIDFKNTQLSLDPTTLDKVQPHKIDATAEPRIGSVLVGVGVSGCPPMVTHKSHTATIRAVLARIMRLNPVTVSAAAWAAVTRLCWDTVLLGFDKQVEPLMTDEWLATFPGPRRRVLQSAYDRWLELGCSMVDTHARWCSKVLRFSIFVKREFLPRCKPEGPQLVPICAYKPRAIQPPPDWSHLAVGVMTKPLTVALEHHWSWDSHLFYAAAPPELLDKWLDKWHASEQWYWSDYTMFDCTHSRHSWTFVEHVYRRVVPREWPLYHMFWKVLEAWRQPVGSFYGKHGHAVFRGRYKGRVMNASGRDDTALANALLNGVATSACMACVYFRVTLEELTPGQWRQFMGIAGIAIVGDDSLAAIPRVDSTGQPMELHRMPGLLAQFGFIAKTGASHNVRDAVFLGNRPYYVRGKWVWGPTLGRRLYKHHCCLNPEASPLSWLAGVVKAECISYNHVPVLGAMARRCSELLTRSAPSPVADTERWIRSIRLPPPDERTYEQCALAYSTATTITTVADLKSLENMIMSINELPFVLHHQAVTNFLLVDDL